MQPLDRNTDARARATEKRWAVARKRAVEHDVRRTRMRELARELLDQRDRLEFLSRVPD